MKNFIKTLMVTGIVAQLAAFAAYAEEKAGESKTTGCTAVSSKNDSKKEQMIVSSDQATEKNSNAASAK